MLSGTFASLLQELLTPVLTLARLFDPGLEIKVFLALVGGELATRQLEDVLLRQL